MLIYKDSLNVFCNLAALSHLQLFAGELHYKYLLYLDLAIDIPITRVSHVTEVQKLKERIDQLKDGENKFPGNVLK